MKKEYDFSRGKRGMFYRPDARLNLPVYLDPEIQSFVEGIAERKKIDVAKVVNDLIRNEMKVAEYIETGGIRQHG